MDKVDRECQTLHLRSCRGEALSAEERKALESWYARLDAEEKAILAGALPPDAADLRASVEEAKILLVETSRDIKKLTQENQGLQREIESLREQIARKKAAKTA